METKQPTADVFTGLVSARAWLLNFILFISSSLFLSLAIGSLAWLLAGRGGLDPDAGLSDGATAGFMAAMLCFVVFICYIGVMSARVYLEKLEKITSVFEHRTIKRVMFLGSISFLLAIIFLFVSGFSRELNMLHIVFVKFIAKGIIVVLVFYVQIYLLLKISWLQPILDYLKRTANWEEHENPSATWLLLIYNTSFVLILLVDSAVYTWIKENYQIDILEWSGLRYIAGFSFVYLHVTYLGKYVRRLI